jgi:4-hydroxy-2-oxoheptanedioate aldolase
MRRNAALAKLRAGGTLMGTMMIYDSADMIEQVGKLGFDFLWLDWQHGQFAEHTLNNALARFLHLDTTPLVRVKGNEPGTINRVLDMGAMGVIVPLVESAEEAKRATDAAYYPPKGRRSAGGIRLTLIGDGFWDYVEKANDEILTVLMVESENAIGNAEAIMRTGAVDVVLIGPGDLKIDVTSRGGDMARHEALHRRVLEAAKKTGVTPGTVTDTTEQAVARAAQGFRFICNGGDYSVMENGMRAMQQALQRR